MDRKKNIVKDISELSKDEHIEIFKIIKNSSNNYTRNDNGIFINIVKIDDETFEKIDNFVNFCKDNREKLKQNDEIIKNEKEKIEKENNKKNIIIEENNKDQEVKENNEEISTISLKRSKPKYTGNKAKIIKTCKQNSGNNSFKKNENKKTSSETI